MRAPVTTARPTGGRARRSSLRFRDPRPILAALVALSLFAPLAARPTSAQDDVRYAEATGHSLGGAFLAAWQEMGGEAMVGLPVSEPVIGEDEVRQYFQRGLLVADGADGTGAVERPDAGAMLLAARTDPTRSASGRRLGASRAVTPGPAEPFDPTVVSIPAPSWPAPDADRIAALAALASDPESSAVLGEPLTAPTVAYGQVVQWFEHGRIGTYTRGSSEPAMAPVGWELALAAGVDVTPIPRGDMTLLGDDTTVAFAGDSTVPEAAGAFAPVRLWSPGLIDAPVESVGIVGGVMQTPVDPMAAGWYSGVSSPGTGSTVVMAGHVDYYTVGPAAFAGLGGSGPGTRFYLVGPDGTGATYEYVTSYVLGASDPADGILAGTGVDSLTLITCTGGFNGTAYDSRLVVYAERV